MIRFAIQAFGLVSLNYLNIIFSKDLDVEQFKKDLDFFGFSFTNDSFIIYIIISISVLMLTLILLFVFKPFIEIYLLHLYKVSFYFLINLLSISTIYIVYRVYGYSRFNFLIYLIFSTFVLLIAEKIHKKVI